MECSTIIEQARKIVAANGFSDKIKLIKSKCEDIENLEALTGVEKVRSNDFGDNAPMISQA